MSIYQHYKTLLTEVVYMEKRDNPCDKLRIRQVIKDTLDSYCRDIDDHTMRGEISERKAEQFKSWLESYACSLHPL